jgi:hypothetical protein
MNKNIREKALFPSRLRRFAGLPRQNVTEKPAKNQREIIAPQSPNFRAKPRNQRKTSAK